MCTMLQDRDTIIWQTQFRLHLVCVNPTFISVHSKLPNLYAQIYGRHSLVAVARPYTTIHRAVLFADAIPHSRLPY
jgi:hypothetical protein